MNISEIFDLDRRAADSVTEYTRERFIMNYLHTCSGRPFVLLQGPRGVGKTVLLRQMRKKTEKSLYISLDTFSPQESLFDIVKTLYDQFAVHTFFIDELHFFPDYAADLKRIFDFLPVQMFCTSSTALSLESAAHDLSRRVQKIQLQACSFREYIYFLHGSYLEPLTFDQLLSADIDRDYLAYAGDFRSYLHGGGYLFTLGKQAGVPQFRQIVSTIMHHDIPAADESLTVKDQQTLFQVIEFIGKSAVDGINFSSTSSNLGITKYTARKYLEFLRDAFLVQMIYPEGTNVLKEPKVLLQPPFRLLYNDFEACIGALREDYFVFSVHAAGLPLCYVKSTRGKKLPDYLISWKGDDIVMEIGGRGKGRSQFKNVRYDKKIILYHSLDDADFLEISDGRMPLFLTGFLPESYAD